MEAAGLCMGRSEANAAKIALIGLNTKTCLDGVVVFVREWRAIGTRLIVGEDPGLMGSMEQPHLSHVAAGASRAAPHYVIRSGKGRNREDPQNHRHGKEQGKQFLHLDALLCNCDVLSEYFDKRIVKNAFYSHFTKDRIKRQQRLGCGTAHNFSQKIVRVTQFNGVFPISGREM